MATINQVRAASQLTQHGEFSAMLAKGAKSTKPVDQEVLREWLDTFFVAARSMGVIPSALDTARAGAYQSHQPLANQVEPIKQPEPIKR